MIAKSTGFARANKRSVGSVSLAQSPPRLPARCDGASKRGPQEPRASETRRTPSPSNLLAKLRERTVAWESPKMTPTRPSKQDSANPDLLSQPLSRTPCPSTPYLDARYDLVNQ